MNCLNLILPLFIIFLIVLYYYNHNATTIKSGQPKESFSGLVYPSIKPATDLLSNTNNDFYKSDLPFSSINQVDKRLYGGNNILQFNDILDIVNSVYRNLENANLIINEADFVEMDDDELCSFNINERFLNDFLTNKINQTVSETFIVSEPTLKILKNNKDATTLIRYYFTLYNPKRETSIDSFATLLIDENKIVQIVNIKANIKFAGEYNGYQKHSNKFSSSFVK